MELSFVKTAILTCHDPFSKGGCNAQNASYPAKSIEEGPRCKLHQRSMIYESTVQVASSAEHRVCQESAHGETTSPELGFAKGCASNFKASPHRPMISQHSLCASQPSVCWKSQVFPTAMAMSPTKIRLPIKAKVAAKTFEAHWSTLLLWHGWSVAWLVAYQADCQVHDTVIQK